jgi:hypothetical protein
MQGLRGDSLHLWYLQLREEFASPQSGVIQVVRWIAATPRLARRFRFNT